MEQNMISSKPLFEFSDLELKAIGFDHYESIKNYENSLNLIRNELSRRTHSKVIATVKEDFLKNITK
jgi:hypothetical protein